MKQAVILAGGKGTRLRERLGSMPKPLVDIGGLPVLERQILLLRRHQIGEVLILVNYGASQIIDYCAARGHWGLDVRCVDDKEPRGTAGATLAVFEQLADEFLVVYGDTMLDVDLTRFHAYHAEIRDVVGATLLLHPNDHPHDSDLVEINEEGFITAFHPYPHDPLCFYQNMVNAALFWVRKQALVPWRTETGMLDFARDLFPAMLHRGLALRGFRSAEYIKDIGTPRRLDEVRADFETGKIEQASLERPQPMVFLDRDGTINKEVDHLTTASQFDLLPDVEGAIRRLNQSQYRVCVTTNQPVIARGECSYEELRQIHNKMETLLGRGGAFIDRIYYCPHHPRSGFRGERIELKMECSCRKPRTGMIDQALQEFRGAREMSWLIGDSSVDIETAKRAHVKSVLVETGYAGLDYRAWATPDAVVPDLPSAVSYILDQYPRLLSYCECLAGGLNAGAIVLIGGLARSGKSTFAAVLRDALLAQGQRAVVVSIDRWLRDEANRESGVMGRYDVGALQSLVELLQDSQRRPQCLTLPGYHKLDRKQVSGVESLLLTNSDVILIEGTIALGLQLSDTADVHKYHIEMDERLRMSRVLREYRLRGSSEQAALAIYASRMEDESPVLEQLGFDAKRISLTSVLK